MAICDKTTKSNYEKSLIQLSHNIQRYISLTLTRTLEKTLQEERSWHENDPYQLIAPIALVQVPQVPRPKREYHELFMLMSQVYDKLKAKGLLKPLDLRPIPNPLPSRLNVNKRCVYHQGLSHETDRCFTL